MSKAIPLLAVLSTTFMLLIGCSTDGSSNVTSNNTTAIPDLSLSTVEQLISVSAQMRAHGIFFQRTRRFD